VTPAARLAAAIEILDEIGRARGAADGVIKGWGKAHRFAGSKDRKAIADTVYTALRARAATAWRMGAEDGRALVLGALSDLSLEAIEALFSGEGHAAPPLSADERVRLTAPPAPTPDAVEAGLPDWLAAIFRRQFGKDWIGEGRSAVLDRAPVDLRVNAARGPVEKALALLAHEGVTPARTPFSAWGLRLPPSFATDVHTLKAFTTGWIEVQDEASQIAAWLAGARPGDLVVDYCAGAGGKTLALLAAMGQAGQGRLIAADIDQHRLNAMDERLARVGATVEKRRIGPKGEGLDDLEGRADLVFVDAPCSGSGTWRRHPEAAWRLTPETVDRLAALQTAILTRAARLVRPGGRLVYATCSVLDQENGAVAAAFAATHPAFRPLAVSVAAQTPNLTDVARTTLAALSGGGHTLQLTPRRTGTDGFFAALFEKTA
jgi:16S rRNA (cytosine967-C5)-methyltransferase